MSEEFKAYYKGVVEKMACGQKLTENDLEVICELGVHYQNGIGTEKNLEKALALFNLASDAGSLLAKFFLSRCYLLGSGVAQDLKKAFDLCKFVADKGRPDAQYALGNYYERGVSVCVDMKSAAKYYQLSSDQGYFESTVELSECYAHGHGVEKNLEKAIELLKSVPDLGPAIKYFERLSERRDSKSDYMLGLFHHRGIGVPMDMKKAIYHYRRAANRQHVEAERALREICHDQSKRQLVGVAKTPVGSSQPVAPPRQPKEKVDLSMRHAPRSTPKKEKVKQTVAESGLPVPVVVQQPFNLELALNELESLKKEALNLAKNLNSELLRLDAFRGIGVAKVDEICQQMGEAWDSLSKTSRSAEQVIRDVSSIDAEKAELSIAEVKRKLYATISPPKKGEDPELLIRRSRTIRPNIEAKVAEQPNLEFESKQNIRPRRRATVSSRRSDSHEVKSPADQPRESSGFGDEKEVKQHIKPPEGREDARPSPDQKATPFAQLAVHAKKLVDLFSCEAIERMDKQIAGYALEAAMFCLASAAQKHLEKSLNPTDLMCVAAIRDRISHARSLVYAPTVSLKEKCNALSVFVDNLLKCNPSIRAEGPVFVRPQAAVPSCDGVIWLKNIMDTRIYVPRHPGALRPQVEEELGVLDSISPIIMGRLSARRWATKEECVVLKLAQYFMLAINPLELLPLSKISSKMQQDLMTLCFAPDGGEGVQELAQQQAKLMGLERETRQCAERLRHMDMLNFLDGLWSDLVSRPVSSGSFKFDWGGRSGGDVGKWYEPPVEAHKGLLG